MIHGRKLQLIPNNYETGIMEDASHNLNINQRFQVCHFAWEERIPGISTSMGNPVMT